MTQQTFLGTFDRRYPRPVQRRHADIVDITRIVRMTTRIPMQDLTRVVLTDILVADFRHSDKSIWNDYVTRYRRQRYMWKPNETVLFVSMGGKLAMWVVGESRINYDVVLDTRRWRLIGDGEVWDEETLVYYAAQAGFKLILPSEQKINEVLGYVEARG